MVNKEKNTILDSIRLTDDSYTRKEGTTNE